MIRCQWLRNLASRLARGIPGPMINRRSRSQAPFRRLGLETLEDRVVLSATFLGDINPIADTVSGSSPMLLTNVNGVLFFMATDATHGQELWKSDGTVAGTVLVKDTLPGSASGFGHF